MSRFAGIVLLLSLLSACNLPMRQPVSTVQDALLVTTPAATETSPFAPMLTATPTLAPEKTKTVVILPTPGLMTGIQYDQLAKGESIIVTTLRMQDMQTGWAALDSSTPEVSGHLLRTEDGGNSWQQVTPPSGYPQGSRFYALDRQQAWAAPANFIAGESLKDGYIWRTVDGGQTWQPSTAITLAYQEQELVESFYPQALFFLDAQQGWLVVSVGHYMNQDVHEIFGTTDSGLTWRRLADKASMGQGQGQDGGASMPCHVSGIAFTDTQHGFLAGDCLAVSVDEGFSILATTDGGRTWQNQSLPEPAGLPQAVITAAVAGQRFCASTGIERTAAGLLVQHTCQVLEGSGALKNYPFLSLSPDGGNSWLGWQGESASFVNTMDGYSLGARAQNGLRQVSVTADGGKNWQAVGTVSWPEAWLDFSIPRQGFALARSWNEQNSAYDYALVRTDNGGQSWSLVKGVIK